MMTDEQMESVVALAGMMSRQVQVVIVAEHVGDLTDGEHAAWVVSTAHNPSIPQDVVRTVFAEVVKELSRDLN